ncbi:uncharacterized protein [Typha latifolia]|uniref:uncharacterized protein n=1 Tax=Typha latifolia TaxID=4733 RepID=UPI003C2C7691
MMSEKPLMLKEYLELEYDEESSDGLDYYPGLAYASTVRHLIDAELRGGARLIRTRSTNALAKFSALVKLKLLPFSNSIPERTISRSFSKRLEGSFWNKKNKKKKKRRGKNEEDAGGRRSDVDKNRISDGDNTKATGHREPSVVGSSESMECHSEEEKEQLSPVSVMDFPYEEDEEEEDETTSPSFHERIAHIERVKLQLLQKIRHFECLGELDPVDLGEAFEAQAESPVHVASSDGEEEKCREGSSAWALLKALKASSTVDPVDCSVQKLLVDFFIERLSCSDGGSSRSDGHDSADLLEAAREWIDGGGRGWELRDEIMKMECNGRWRCFEEEEREFAMELDVVLFESLVDELVRDLVSR